MTGIGDVEKAMARALAVPGFAFEKEQAEALRAPLLPQVINAGAGTGKTTVMAGRVVWLVGTGQVRPDQVLALTFTRKAAQELGEDIAQALEAAGFTWDGLAATYDSFASDVVEEFSVLRGMDPSVRLVDSVEPYMVADRVVRQAEGDFPLLSLESWGEVVKGVVSLDSHLQSHLLSVDEVVARTHVFLQKVDTAGRTKGQEYAKVSAVRQVCERRLEYLRLVDWFREAKVVQGIATFADRMAQAVELAEKEPRVPETLRGRYRVVLLDEYQDTSVAQARFLSALFSRQGEQPQSSGEAGAEPGTSVTLVPTTGLSAFPVTAVGDPLQAIYGWRGAGDDTLAGFADFFGQAEEYTLVRNRRSGQVILDAANAVTRLMPQAYLAAQDSPHTRRKINRLTPLVARELEAATDKAARVEARQFQTWPQEAAWIAADIEKTAHEGHVKTREDGSAYVDYGDFAILVRRRAEISELRQTLDDLGIPVSVQGLAGLMTIPLVSQITAMMKVLTDPDANPEMLEILSGPRFLLGRKDLEVLGRHAKDLVRARGGLGADERLGGAGANERGTADARDQGVSSQLIVSLSTDEEPRLADQDPVRLIDAVLDEAGVRQRRYTPTGRRALLRLGEDLRVLSRLGDDAVAVLMAILDRCGIMAQAQFESEMATRHVRHFVSLVTEYCAEHDSSLTGLLAYLGADEAYGEGLEQPPDTGANAVVISTVHSAKGLDWDEVYLPALCDKVFPSTTLKDNPLTQASVLPTDIRSDRASLPRLADYDNLWGTKPHNACIHYEDDLRNDVRASEDRLAYVAVTRPKRRLVATCHVWGAAHLKEPRDPSEYFQQVAEVAKTLPAVDASTMEGELVCEGAYIHLLIDAEATRGREKGPNPLAVGDGHGQWPDEPDDTQANLAGDVRDCLREKSSRHRVERSSHLDAGVESQDVLAYADAEDLAIIAGWDTAIETMENEATRERNVEVSLPTPLSASFVLAFGDRSESMARDMARPMPPAPKGEAVLGSAFHAWAERHFGHASLLDEEDTVADPPGLGALKDTFLASRFASASARWVEREVHDSIAGRVISGRIDAVFWAGDNPDLVPEGKDWLIVDWKTGRRGSDPGQLGLYAHGLARELDVPMSRMAAGFFHVATGEWEEVHIGSPDEVVRLVSRLHLPGPSSGETPR
ncbi:MAG: ATP-dependent helicase [Propionibacteriaceae bacterium]|nr:ATP-dependent helicase [Propionibacteriaceae bacterium]